MKKIILIILVLIFLNFVSAQDESIELSLLKLETFEMEGQIEEYLEQNPQSLEALKQNEEFKSILFQEVGKGGYGLLFDPVTGLIKIHPNENVIDVDLFFLEKKFPDWATLNEQIMKKKEICGRYSWEEPDGTKSNKYMCSRKIDVDDEILMLIVSGYVDGLSEEDVISIGDISQISNLVRKSAAEISSQVETFLLENPTMSDAELQSDSEFREIVIKILGKTSPVALVNSRTGDIFIHQLEHLQGKNALQLSKNFPDLYSIVLNTIGEECHDTSGFYKWNMTNGNVREKYAFQSCVHVPSMEDTNFYVTASVFLDEFSFDKEIEKVGVEILDKEERRYLQENVGKIKYAPDPNYAPFEFYDELGFLKGIGAEYISLIEKKINFSFTRVRLDTLDDVYEAAKNGEIHLTAASTKTPGRSKYLHFSTPYHVAKNVIIVNSDVKENLEFEDIIDRKIVFVKGYAVYDFALFKFPDINAELVNSPSEGLRKISFGEADAMILDIPTASYDIEQEGISNLRIAGEIEYDVQLAIASVQSEPILANILHKGLDSITDKEKEEIQRKWIKLKVFDVFNQYIFYFISFIVIILIIFIVVVIWNKSLQKQVKQVSQYLVESEKKYRTVFEKSTDPVMLIEGDRFVDYNNATIKILGMKQKKKVSELHPSDISPEKQPDGQISFFKANKMMQIAYKNGSHRFEWIHKTVKGKLFPVEVVLTALPGPKKRIYVVWRDITERKKAEKLLKAAHLQLEKKVRERTAELQKAYQELKDLDTKKDQFISLAAHELKTPLTSIRGFSQLLSDKDILKNKKKTRRYLDLIDKNTGRLYNLVMDLIDSTRISLGKLKIIKKKISVNHIISDIKQSMAFTFKEKNIIVKYDFSKGLYVKGDPERIQQVLRNILANAIQFSKPKSTVSVNAKKSGKFLQFSIKDSGVGIPKNKQDIIFERFYQVDDIFKKSVQGSGMGLSICRGLIRLMGGKIWVESELGKGSTFYFTIPIA